MGFFPLKAYLSALRNQGLKGAVVDASFVSHLFVDNALAASVNRFVTSASMKVGAYTVANGTVGDGSARAVTVTHTIQDTLDTLGTITVTGTDLGGNIISDVITPSNGITVSGVKAFKTVTSVVGAGWVIGGTTADLITVGFNEKIGLPDALSLNTVLFAFLGGTKEGTAPTVTVDADEPEKNLVDLSTALNGTDVDVFYVV